MADLRERGTSFLTEFGDFAVKGNATGLAIGSLIGLAFGTVVSPHVGDAVAPLAGSIIAGVDFSSLFVVLRNPESSVLVIGTAAMEAGISAPVLIGVFLNAVVLFTITALSFPGREGDQLQ